MSTFLMQSHLEQPTVLHMNFISQDVVHSLTHSLTRDVNRTMSQDSSVDIFPSHCPCFASTA